MGKVRLIDFSIRTISMEDGILRSKGERFAINGTLTSEKKEAIIKILNEEECDE